MITINGRNFDPGQERYGFGSFFTRPRRTLSYDDVLRIWNEQSGIPVVGTPSIDYENDMNGQDGILLPGDCIRLAYPNNTRFNLEWDCSRD